MREMKGKRRVCYHDNFPLHVEQERIIIPFGPMLHVFEKEKGFTYTLNYLALMAFPPCLTLSVEGRGTLTIVKVCM